MAAMRTLLLSAALAAAAAPAAAQALGPADQMQLDMLRMEAQRRAIDQANQLEALDARLRAEQTALDLRLQRGDVGPRTVPGMPYATAPSRASSSSARFPSIPDAALADSNRRVQDAAGNRR